MDGGTSEYEDDLPVSSELMDDDYHPSLYYDYYDSPEVDEPGIPAEDDDNAEFVKQKNQHAEQFEDDEPVADDDDEVDDDLAAAREADADDEWLEDYDDATAGEEDEEDAADGEEDEDDEDDEDDPENADAMEDPDSVKKPRLKKARKNETAKQKARREKINARRQAKVQKQRDAINQKNRTIQWKEGDPITVTVLKNVWEKCKNIKPVQPLMKTASEAAEMLIMAQGGTLTLKICKTIHNIGAQAGEFDFIDTLLLLATSTKDNLVFLVVAAMEAIIDQMWTQVATIALLPKLLPTIIDSPPLNKFLQQIFKIAVPLINKASDLDSQGYDTKLSIGLRGGSVVGTKSI